MSALTPKDRRLLDRMELLVAINCVDQELTSADVEALAKLARRLARRIDGPGSKNPGKRARQKGQELQREVANLLKPVYPDASSNSQYRGARRDGCDVGGTPFWIEAKNRKDGSVFTAYRQAMRDKAKAEDARPVLIATTRNREPVLVAMHVSTLVNLLETGATPEPMQDWPDSGHPRWSAPKVRMPCPPGCRTVTQRVDSAHCPECRREFKQKEAQQ